MPSFSSVMTRGRLEDLVAEHCDNLYYLNDIFSLEVHSVNNVLEAQVLKKFLIPLYVHSLVPEKTDSEVCFFFFFFVLIPHYFKHLVLQQGSKLSPLVSLYLLAQVVSVFSHSSLINLLVAVLVSQNDTTYKALIEEFKLETSEVKITSDPSLCMTSGGSPANIFRLAILDYMNAKDTDLLALPALCLLMAIMKNKAIDRTLAASCGLESLNVLQSKALMVGHSTAIFL